MNAAWSWETLDAFGFHAIGVLLSVLWQSSLLLGVAAVLAHLMRRQSAAARHAVWVAALALVALLPLMGWLASRASLPQAQIQVIPAYSAPAEDARAAAYSLAADPAVTVPPPAGEVRSVLCYPWALALIGYVAGASLLLLMVLAGHIHLGLWIRGGRIVTDPHVLHTFGTAARGLRLPLGIRLVEHPHVPSPLTTGSSHPVIFLPEGFLRRLSDSETAGVALHEMAHIRRRDAQVIRALSCLRAVLFFHPLVWLACHRVSVLAEASCDDIVVQTTGQPLPYARMLTRLAEELVRGTVATEIAVGFALSKRTFFKRIEAILSHRGRQVRRLSHAAMAGIVLVAVASIALAITLPLGEKAATDVAGQAGVPPRPTVEDSARDASAAAGDGQAAQRSIDAIAALGGILTRDDTLPGRPVTGVALADTGNDTDLRYLKALPYLTSLTLFGTRVTDAGLGELKELKGLRTLSLADTRVTDTGLAELRDLTGLEELSLAYTGVTDAGLKNLKGLQGLRALNLQHTAVTDAGIKELRELKSLRRLALADTGIGDAGLGELKELKGLILLDLTRTQVTDAALRELSGFAGLRCVVLGGAAVTDASMRELEGLRDLRTLLLDKTRVTPQGARNLQQVLPNLTIEGVAGVPLQSPSVAAGTGRN
jgi:Zn-dependent protease with chaperone function